MRVVCGGVAQLRHAYGQGDAPLRTRADAAGWVRQASRRRRRGSPRTYHALFSATSLARRWRAGPPRHARGAARRSAACMPGAPSRTLTPAHAHTAQYHACRISAYSAVAARRAALRLPRAPVARRRLADVSCARLPSARTASRRLFMRSLPSYRSHTSTAAAANAIQRARAANTPVPLACRRCWLPHC